MVDVKELVVTAPGVASPGTSKPTPGAPRAHPPGILQRVARELGLCPPRRAPPPTITTTTASSRSASTQLPPMPASRSSVSSVESDPHGISISMSKRWTTLETVGRCMFLFSVAFFIIGVLITVFGFSNTGINPSHQVPLQVLGPACLTMTIVMWIVGCIFSRLWNLEWKRQQQALELRDRVQLHALAMDILNNPVISPSMLHDPRMRRQLLLKLRSQRAIDLR